MKCNLIYYCAIVFYLSFVESLPYAFNVPRYPIQNDERPLKHQYISPQQHWNKQQYNANYQDQEFHEEYPDQKFNYGQQDHAPNNPLRYDKRHPIHQKIPSSNTNNFREWPQHNEWRNTEPIRQSPDNTKSVTKNQNFDQDNQHYYRKSPPSAIMRDKNILKKYPSEFKQENEVPSTSGILKLFNPPIPAIPRKFKNQAAIERNVVTEKIIPIKFREYNKTPRKESLDSNDRFFASSTNPIETISTSNPMKDHIQRLISNSKIREMITSRKSQSRYLVVYPNGTMERANTLKTIADQNPNYVLVHAGNLFAKPIPEATVDLSTTPTPTIRQNFTTTIKESPSVESTSSTSDITTIKTLGPAQVVTSSAELSLIPTDVEIARNKTIPRDSPSRLRNDFPNIRNYSIVIPPRTVIQLSVPLKPKNGEVPKLLNQSPIRPDIANEKSSSEPVPVSKPPKQPIVQTIETSHTKIPPKILQQAFLPNAPIPPVMPTKIPTKGTVKPVPVDVRPLQINITSNGSKTDHPVVASTTLTSVENTTKDQITKKNPPSLVASVAINHPKGSLSSEKNKTIPNVPNMNKILNSVQLPKDIRINNELVKNSTSASNSSITSTITPKKVPGTVNNLSTTLATPVVEKTKEQKTTPAFPTETTASTIKENDKIKESSIMRLIPSKDSENKTLHYLPGNLDISNVKTDKKPIVWFKKTDKSFWDKISQGSNDFDILYFFQINRPPMVENDVSRTIYPNGTVIEVLTKTVWDINSDKPTITKTTKVIHPEGLPII